MHIGEWVDPIFAKHFQGGMADFLHQAVVDTSEAVQNIFGWQGKAELVMKEVSVCLSGLVGERSQIAENLLFLKAMVEANREFSERLATQSSDYQTRLNNAMTQFLGEMKRSQDFLISAMEEKEKRDKKFHGEVEELLYHA